MSKSVVAAYNAYPLTNENKCNNEINARRLGFQQGYEQAEKEYKNQWISIEEALPTENRIIARLSKSFCGTKDCIEVLHFCERYGLTSPEGYYDLCGENIPTNAITHWMPVPSLEGDKK